MPFGGSSLGMLSGASPVCFARRNLMSKLNDSAAQTIPRAIKRKMSP